MSELSAREVTAGISRKALSTFERRNGANGRSPLARQESLADHLAGKAIGIPEKTSVIDTWNRNLDLINLSGWHFSIRETDHANNAVHVVEMFFSRPELEMLAQRIQQVLQSTPAQKPGESA